MLMLLLRSRRSRVALEQVSEEIRHRRGRDFALAHAHTNRTIGRRDQSARRMANDPRAIRSLRLDSTRRRRAAAAAAMRSAEAGRRRGARNTMGRSAKSQRRGQNNDSSSARHSGNAGGRKKRRPRGVPPRSHRTSADNSSHTLKHKAAVVRTKYGEPSAAVPISRSMLVAE